MEEDLDYASAEQQELDYGQGAAEVIWAEKNANKEALNTTDLPITNSGMDMSKLTNEQFAISRRQGFGGSDASILIGANPYTKTYMEVHGRDGITEPLVVQKAREQLTESEKKVGELAAVRKGNDLEALIMNKAAEAMGIEIRKPTHLYRFTDTPYLAMNFDGVGVFVKPEKNEVVDPNAYRKELEVINNKYDGEFDVLYKAPDFSWVANHHGYAPVEIKVATTTGQRKYEAIKAIYSEERLYKQLDPWREAPTPLTPEELRVMSIEEKAHYFGIPIYYYPQVQQEMMALDANGGFLAVMFDVSWQMHIFYVQKDPYVQNQIVIEGYKAAKTVNDIVRKQGRPEVMQLG